jgi:AraC family transcriptional regulator of arabinose operon
MPDLLQNISSIHRVLAGERVIFGDVTYQPGGVCGPRIQADYQLVAIYTGEAHITVDEEMRHLPANHVSLMRPGHLEHFVFSLECDTHHTWCAVHPSLVDGTLREALIGVPFCLPITTRMHTLIEMGLSFAPSDIPNAQGVVTQLGLAALHEFVFETERAALRSLTPDAVIKAQHFIELHLPEPIKLDDIAKVANVTPQHLVKLFNQHLRITPMRFVWNARLRRGVELLMQSGLTVSEVAEQCGFQTPFHFSRLVKQHYHMSPKELRRRAWKQS